MSGKKVEKVLKKSKDKVRVIKENDIILTGDYYQEFTTDDGSWIVKDDDPNIKKDNVVKDKSFNFAIRVINLYKYIIKEENEFVISKQILRSGTAIGANIEEALGGVSRKDFANKLSIAYKEARETEYWLKLLFETNYISKSMFDSLFNDCNEVTKLLYVIIRKTRDY
ncbi:MAG TPA: four helix bundle protein [Ignavibacteria bacterium]